MGFSKDIVDLIEDLRNRTTNNIASIQSGLIPAFIDTNWQRVNYYIVGDARYDDIDEDQMVFRVNNLKFKLDNGRKDQLVFVENALTAITETAKIHPFMLFINGQFIKWSNITIVRELKYNYLVVKGTSKFSNADTLDIIHLPFNVSYTETREVHNDQVEMFRFDEDGLLSGWGKTIIFASIPELYYKSSSYLEGAVIEDSDLNFDKRYKIVPNNFFFFKNKKLCTDTIVTVKNMNVVTLNNAEPLDGEFVYKIFYRSIVNQNISNIMIPDNDEFLKQVLTKAEASGNIDIIALEKDFNFKFSEATTYTKNIANAVSYLHLYNSNLVNKVYEDRSLIKTIRLTGKEVNDRMHAVGYKYGSNFVVLRGKFVEKDTFVMIFRNGKLDTNYRFGTHTANRFYLPITDTINDTDIFEIIYFKGVNNSIVKTNITTTTNVIQNRPIDKTELTIWSQYVENRLYNNELNDRTVYPVAYIIDENNKISFLNTAYYGKDIIMAAENQFRYCCYEAQERTVTFTLTEEFMTCQNPAKYLVFINGALISKNMYKLLIEGPDNTFIEPTIHSRIMLNPGDKIEVFYVPVAFQYTDIGTTNQTDIYKVQAVIDRQPMFTIPFPVGNYLDGKNSFFVMLGSLVMDPTRYNVIGNKLIFISAEDYVELGRELVFVFMYNKASIASDIEYIREQDHILFDIEYKIVTSQDQTVFSIPYPYEGFEDVGGFFVTYRGLYVSESRYTVSNGRLIFNTAIDDIDINSAMIFTFYRPNSETNVSSVTTIVEAIVSNQTIFTIPIPYENYFKQNNKFFVTRNGTFLSDDDYVINYDENILELATPEGLDLGQELVFTFMYGDLVSVKTAIIEVKAETDGQMEFDVPLLFDNYTVVDDKFFLIVGTTFIDRRRYVIENNKVIFTNLDDAMFKDRILSFLFIYTVSTALTESIDLDESSANKYTNIESLPVTATVDNQKTFIVPKAEAILMDKKFFVSVGSVFISSDSYTTDYATNTITFAASVEAIDIGRTVLFTFISSEYVVIEKEIVPVTTEVDGQTEFDIPVPFINYLSLNNKCILFIGGTYIDPDRYTVDNDTNKLSFISMSDGVPIGRSVVFMFIYVANQLNDSFTRDDVTATKLPEYGYIYLSKDAIKYSMTKDLYFLFVNGKKVELDNIKNISSNLIRIKRDIQSRYNTCILNYTPQIEEFEQYFRIFSEYDQIINKLSIDELNKLFGIYTTISNTEPKLIPTISQEAIINNIIRFHYMANGVNDGLPFIYSYEKGILKDRAKDIDGNYIFDTMVADADHNVDL